MKQNLTNVPEVKLNDVEHFYVMGSRHKDGILGVENQKVDLKEIKGGGEDDKSVGLPEVNLLQWPEESLATQPHYFPISDVLSEEDLETIRKNGIVKAKLTEHDEDGDWEGYFLVRGTEGDDGLYITLYDSTEAYVLIPNHDEPASYSCTAFKMLPSHTTDVYQLSTSIEDLRDNMNTSALANIGIESPMFLDFLNGGFKSFRFANNVYCQIVCYGIDSTTGNGIIDFIGDRTYYRLQHVNGQLNLRMQNFVTFEAING